MNAEELRARQGPIKQTYCSAPESALVTSRVALRLDSERLAVRLADRPPVAGLHPSTGVPFTGGQIIAEGLWDARGTLGVDKAVSVGIQNIRLMFALEGRADRGACERLVGTAERYCREASMDARDPVGSSDLSSVYP